MQCLGSCCWISPWAHRVRVEFREHDARGSHPQRAQQLVDHPVDVVQGQHVQDHILLLPLPLLNQPRGLQKKTNSTALGQEGRLSIPEVPKFPGRNAKPARAQNLSFRISVGKIPTTKAPHKRNTFSILSGNVFKSAKPFLVTEKYQQ